MPSPRQNYLANKVVAGNLGRVFPLPPPPFPVDACRDDRTNAERLPRFLLGLGDRDKSIAQLHKERMIKTEKDVGSAFSKAAKDFIGSQADAVWRDNDAFGVWKTSSPSARGKETATLKSILKRRSQYQNNAIQSPRARGVQRPRTTERRGKDASSFKEKHRVRFDLVEQVIPNTTIFTEFEEPQIPNPVAYTRALPKIKSRADTGKGLGYSTEELKLVRGYAFLATPGDKAYSNTFAKPKPLELFPVLEGGFRRNVDMEGFLDSEISFETDDSSVLVVTGLRSNRGGLNPRKVVEVVELPDGTYHETLLVSRDAQGILTIQQQKTYKN